VCGRIVSTSSPDALALVFGADIITADAVKLGEQGPRDNVPPTLPIFVVVDKRQMTDESVTNTRALTAFRWGLIPSWSREGPAGPKLHNARAETVAEKPSFRAAFAKRRCLIPVDGFYEWQRAGFDGPAKDRPVFRFDYGDDQPFALAGIWETWRPPLTPSLPSNFRLTESADSPDSTTNSDPTSVLVRSVAVITRPADQIMSPIHNRMPAVIHGQDWDLWCDPSADAGQALSDAYALLR
jgi:putative SOS response-associated peptidase YedK